MISKILGVFTAILFLPILMIMVAFSPDADEMTVEYND